MDPHRLTNEPAILNSLKDNKSFFVNLEVCSSPVTAVCDTGASVSCISQRLLKRLPGRFFRGWIHRNSGNESSHRRPA